MNTNKLLKDLGLNTTSITIYMHLLNEKRSTILQLARATGISRTSVYAGVEVLKQWGLVGDAIEGNKKYIYAESPTNLINAVHIKETIASKAAEALLPIFETGEVKPKIQFGHGNETFKKYAYQMLDCKEKCVRQILNTEALMSYMNKKFFEKYWEDRVKKNVYAKILINSSEKNGNLVNSTNNKHSKMLRELKFLPPELQVNISLAVYDDKVQFFSKKEESFIFLFENKSFASTVKNIFDYLWLNT